MHRHCVSGVSGLLPQYIRHNIAPLRSITPHRSLGSTQHHHPQHPLSHITIPYRLYTTRDRLRMIARHKIKEYRSKKAEESRIIFGGWIRLGPKPVRRLKLADLRSRKDWNTYLKTTTRYERLMDGLEGNKEKYMFKLRMFALGGSAVLFAALIYLEMKYQPTKQPGYYSRAWFSPEQQEKFFHYFRSMVPYAIAADPSIKSWITPDMLGESTMDRIEWASAQEKAYTRPNAETTEDFHEDSEFYYEVATALDDPRKFKEYLWADPDQDKKQAREEELQAMSFSNRLAGRTKDGVKKFLGFMKILPPSAVDPSIDIPQHKVGRLISKDDIIMRLAVQEILRRQEEALEASKEHTTLKDRLLNYFQPKNDDLAIGSDSPLGFADQQAIAAVSPSDLDPIPSSDMPPHAVGPHGLPAFPKLEPFVASKDIKPDARMAEAKEESDAKKRREAKMHEFKQLVTHLSKAAESDDDSYRHSFTSRYDHMDNARDDDDSDDNNNVGITSSYYNQLLVPPLPGLVASDDVHVDDLGHSRDIQRYYAKDNSPTTSDADHYQSRQQWSSTSPVETLLTNYKTHDGNTDDNGDAKRKT